MIGSANMAFVVATETFDKLGLNFPTSKKLVILEMFGQPELSSYGLPVWKYNDGTCIEVMKSGKKFFLHLFNSQGICTDHLLM